MQMTMSMRLAIECRVCRQEISSEERRDSLVAAALFGSVRYAICPCCGQEVEDHRDANYRQRARRWIRKETANA